MVETKYEIRDKGIRGLLSGGYRGSVLRGDGTRWAPQPYLAAAAKRGLANANGYLTPFAVPSLMREHIFGKFSMKFHMYQRVSGWRDSGYLPCLPPAPLYKIKIPPASVSRVEGGRRYFGKFWPGVRILATGRTEAAELASSRRHSHERIAKGNSDSVGLAG